MNRLFKTMLYGPQASAEGSKVEKRDGESQLALAFAQYQDFVAQNDDIAIPAVYRGIQYISDTVASLPLRAKVRSTGLVVAETPDILVRPNPQEMYIDTLANITASLVVRGNAYLIPFTRDSRGEPTSIIVPNPDEVTVSWDSRKLFRKYAWRDRELEPNEEIVHISLNRLPGYVKGIGPITAARLLMQGVHAEERYAKNLFEDDATPPLTINIPHHLTADEASAVLAQWEDTHTGRKRPAVLGSGVTVTPIGISPADAEFISQRQFSVQQVARLLGIPGPLLLAEMGGSLTYSTTETLFRMFITSTLNPTYLERIQEAFSILLPSHLKAEFDTTELLRADMQTRYTAYEVGIDAGFLTVDEVRMKEGLEPFNA